MFPDVALFMPADPRFPDVQAQRRGLRANPWTNLTHFAAPEPLLSSSRLTQIALINDYNLNLLHCCDNMYSVAMRRVSLTHLIQLSHSPFRFVDQNLTSLEAFDPSTDSLCPNNWSNR